jgi:cell division septum initiation protein DivIVA
MSEAEELRRRLAALEREVAAGKSITRDDVDAMTQAQIRADSIGSMLGFRVPAPNLNETPMAYRKRLLEKFKQHSPNFKNAHMASIQDCALPLVENQVYADAQAASRTIADGRPGELFPYQERDIAGRLVTKFQGDNLAWMQHFMRGGNVGRIDREMSQNAARSLANMGKGKSQ